MKVFVLFCMFALFLNEKVFASHTRWPDGQYCLPMPPSQICPIGWEKGYRHHDSEDYKGSGHHNRRNGHVPYLTSFGRNLGWGFCCKIRKYSYPKHKSWPNGGYCIFRKGGTCPRHFHQGSIHWDDEDSRNSNSHSGTLPDGVYNRNTKMYFCCRNDGSRSLKGLPSHETFMLMRYKGKCPAVAGQDGPYDGYLDWDTEDSRNTDEKLGVYPDGNTRFGSGIKIEFCTYK